MDKNQFKSFCKNEFQKRGFKKVKSLFFLPGEEVMCCLDLQKSDYSNVYYINYHYFIGDYRSQTVFPSRYDFDIFGSRICVMSKKTDKGKYYMTAMIEYELYTEDELRPFFDKEFEELILPPVYNGKKYILDHLGDSRGFYSLKLIHPEEAMQKLLDD